MPSPIRAAAVVATLAFAVAVGGCGRKGPLEPPPGVKEVEVRNPDGTTEKRIPKPDRPFVLDGLLN